MMDSLQMKKATEALMRLDADARNSRYQKLRALCSHYISKMLIGETYLPYKILFDLAQRKHAGDSEVIMPSEWYPLRQIPFELNNLYFMQMSYIGDGLHEMERDGTQQYSLPIREKISDIEKRIEAESQKYRKWDINSDNGKEKWEYYFAHFLAGYDIEHFTSKDFIGSDDLTDETLHAFRTHYRALQRRYNKTPNKYYDGYSESEVAGE